MSGNNNPPTPVPGVREAAIALLAAMDREGEAVWEATTDAGVGPYGEALAVQSRAKEALRTALQNERTAEPEISNPQLAREGIELIERSAPPGELRPEHIVAVVEAAKDAFTAARSFSLRCDADMRGIRRWQDAAPPGVDRSLVWPDHADLVVWLLELIETMPACASLDEVRAARDGLDGSDRAQWRAQKVIDQLADALIASSRRTLLAEGEARAAKDALRLRLDMELPIRAEANGYDFAGKGGGEPIALRRVETRRAGAVEETMIRTIYGPGEDHPRLDGHLAIMHPPQGEEAWPGESSLIAGPLDEIAERYKARGFVVRMEGAHLHVEPKEAAGPMVPVEPGLRVYDSLRNVLQRPDVEEALAKAIASELSASWVDMTEEGRNCFRERARAMLARALAAPRESPPAREKNA